MGETTGKVAIVTGASSGIGAATARALQAKGFEVYAAARRVDRMAPLAEAGIRVLAADVTDDASMVALVEGVREGSGRVDVLVNNAGYGSYGALEEVPIDEGRRQFEVNVFGLARMTQLVLPHMRRQGSGRIVNVSSIGGKIYEPFGAWYHASKFAVEGLSDSLRLELGPLGIRVIVIEPGVIATEWAGIAADGLIAASGDGPYADRARRHAKVLRSADELGGASSPEGVAKVIVRAVAARHPHPRYAMGKAAKPLMIARRLLPDRAYDRLLKTAYGATGG